MPIRITGTLGRGDVYKDQYYVHFDRPENVGSGMAAFAAGLGSEFEHVARDYQEGARIEIEVKEFDGTMSTKVGRIISINGEPYNRPS